ncbi:MAG: histidine--tRNA ligase [Gemmatimonadetes bacterium]|nr:histidine--tRNA ligase [Gemmatimonadota bacterium]
MYHRALSGFRDFYPPETALRNHIIDTWRTVAGRYGFEEYDGPPLESLDLYTEKSGQEIVEQLYAFEDKGGRAVALRPEMTPTLARMVAARAESLKKPIRWFSVPQLFRYERKQRGRLREHYQLNVDVIGERSYLADAEVIAVAVDILRALGLADSDFCVRISDRNVIRALLINAGVEEGQLECAYAAVDKIEREKAKNLTEMMVKAGIDERTATEVLRIAQLKGLADVAEAVEKAGQDSEVIGELDSCVDALFSMGMGGVVTVDCSVIRGLAYYTGVVFEIFDSQRSMRAICGGGRYDGLLESLGGVDLPGVGFGMGDVVLSELLKDRGLEVERVGLDVFTIAITPDDQAEILSISHTLRDLGLRVEYPLKQQALGKQLRLADARGARIAVIVGPDERSENKVLVKNLKSGSEQRVHKSQLTREFFAHDG